MKPLLAIPTPIRGNLSSMFPLLLLMRVVVHLSALDEKRLPEAANVPSCCCSLANVALTCTLTYMLGWFLSCWGVLSLLAYVYPFNITKKETRISC